VSELSSAQAAVLKTLGPLDGARLPGGCGHCNAYQTVLAIEAGIWNLNVHHDEWCPVLARQAQQS